VLGDEYETLSEQSEHYDAYNDYAMNKNKLHPEKIGSSQDATKDDLMFSTEVDTAGMDFSRNQNNSMHQLKAKESRMIDDNAASTRMSDYGNLSLPQNLDSDMMEQREIEEFKDVLKELIAKEADNTMRLEERILAKMKKKALSRGWDRQTGVKVAPLRILASMSTQ